MSLTLSPPRAGRADRGNRDAPALCGPSADCRKAVVDVADGVLPSAAAPYPCGCAGRCADTGSNPADAADAGMSTVEYAVGTVVAAAFAAVLYRIVTGDSIVSGLTNLISSALETSF